MRRLAHLPWLAALALTPACIQDPPPPLQCYTDAECDSGETCAEDGLCYGNPPALSLVAEVRPPTDRADLAPFDGLTVSPSQSGVFQLSLGTPVEVRGRVVLAGPVAQPIAAQVIFRRPSRIPGVPDYVVTARSAAMVSGDAPSFVVRLAPTLPGEKYQVAIYPDDGAPADQAPPYRQDGFTFELDVDPMATPAVPPAPTVFDVTFALGGQNAEGARKVIEGRVVDATQQGVPGLQVRAFGRFGPLDRLELASSRGKTDADGRFAVVVPVAWLDVFEVRLTPPSGAALPSIVLHEVTAPDPVGAVDAVLTLPDIELPPIPKPLEYKVHVEGEAPEGGVEPATGARVTMRTVLVDEPGRTMTFSAEGVVGKDGYAPVVLLPGDQADARPYLVNVTPPVNTPHRAMFAVGLGVGAQGGIIELGQALGQRVLLSGVLRDSTGLAQKGVTVTVQPSLRFRYDLATSGQPFDPDAAQWPMTVTNDKGRFALWLEADILGVEAGYELAFDPPAGGLLPRWVLDEVLPAGGPDGNLDLADIWLPDGANVKGRVADDLGASVPDAIVRVYELRDTAAVCTAVSIVACDAPAVLRAQGQTGDDGRLRLVLPRP